MATRGLRLEDLILGAQPASSATLAAWTLDADRVLVF
jgi:sulfur relay (sulfurtransferase) complex TusBCD TusD component (DsrE family)